ncbi:hypothetical protein PgNI_05732 [Pyricularia grisea]|uniref:Uncharacterized protein n=1 Tax=Pyricularia grisea TaxID=148305 RepID=A0A6P8B4L3_PYRGI|nr:hypothetical protein PgNI_05732 [Pyricularia grisea]TLD10069.1 hypothetical protein PgNI_05732 [Pyricularia grisea]
MYAIFARGKFLPSPWCNHRPGRMEKAPLLWLVWDASSIVGVMKVLDRQNGLDSARP